MAAMDAVRRALEERESHHVVAWWCERQANGKGVAKMEMQGVLGEKMKTLHGLLDIGEGQQAHMAPSM